MSVKNVAAFFAIPSFEPRSAKAIKEFATAGGDAKAVRTIRLSKNTHELVPAISDFNNFGIHNIPFVSREDAKSLWEWVWSNTKDVQGEIVVDATCFTRELLGMLLFALSVRREYLERVEIQYVSAGPAGYVTQNTKLVDDDRWLSKGVVGIRSIIGYPGDFRSEQRRRVVAFAGHEKDRLWETIEFLEPDELSISNEQLKSSTVEGAAEISNLVNEALRDKIQPPKVSSVEFRADSIHETYESLIRLLEKHTDENVAFVPMNTKLSFIGAAFAALHNRNVRLVYAVPETYNPLYSSDEGDLKAFDVTALIKTAETTQVRSVPTE